MRLLARNDGRLSLTKDLLHDIPPYSILSHTWGPDDEEVTFADLVNGTGEDKAGYEKIRFCAEQARRDGLRYFWVDTCCIDKSNNNELFEAINSMFRWYQNAARCYVYLSDIVASNYEADGQLSELAWRPAFRASRWFTRGWTLQELLAPASVEFFTKDEQRLGDKRSLEQQIHEATGIAVLALRGRALSEFDVEERFRWAQIRRTTREEDWAYSLLGIFGVFMPLLYGEGKANAVRRLRKEISDAMDCDDANRQKAPQSPRTRHFVIPFERNKGVVARGIFAELERLLPPSAAHQSAALWGLGGSGKTQIALEFAYRRYGDVACSVFWVHADSETAFAQDYKRIAEELGVQDIDGEKMLAAVRGRIEAEPGWVLVLDNADDLRLFGVGQASAGLCLHDFVPRGATGTVLWTSRDEEIGSLVGLEQAINVSCMTDDEAIALLERVRGKPVGEERNAVGDLLAELDWLPLAISQAAAYLWKTKMPIGDYLARLRDGKKRHRLLKTPQFDRYRRRHVPNSILETWNISIEQVRCESGMAYSILYTQAFLDSKNIPYELVRKAAIFGLGNGDEHDDDDEEVLMAAARLREFSFFSIRSDGRTYDMHKLVQEAARYSLQGKSDEAYFSKAALRVIADLFPDRRRELWEQCEKYVGHAQRVGEWAELSGEVVETSMLLTRVSDYLYDRGRWREKESIDGRAHELRKTAVGERHLDTTWSMAELATTYNYQGRYSEAEKIEVDVLALRREMLGERHPDTMESMASLAATYHAQGRYNEAEKIEVNVLALQREILGERHPDTIQTMASLAVTYHAQGRYDEAEKIKVDVLTLRREVLGERHPDTIESMASLATTYHAQRRYVEAEKIKVDVLALRREVLDERHPSTIRSMASLAATYHDQGRYDQAEKIKVDVLVMRREVLGERHPDTIRSMAELAATYYNQRRYNEAETIYMDALALRREVLGKTHPDTLQSMQHLAETWHRQGRKKEAVVLMDECCQQRRSVLGIDHIRTRQSARELEAWKGDASRQSTA